MNIRHITAICLLSLATTAAAAVNQRSAAVGELAPYCSPANAPSYPAITFMHDGTSYVERSQDGKRLIVKDIASGKELSTLFDVTHTRETVQNHFLKSDL